MTQLISDCYDAAKRFFFELLSLIKSTGYKSSFNRKMGTFFAIKTFLSCGVNVKRLFQLSGSQCLFFYIISSFMNIELFFHVPLTLQVALSALINTFSVNVCVTQSFLM